jgi:hypothetical protein
VCQALRAAALLALGIPTRRRKHSCGTGRLTGGLTVVVMSSTRLECGFGFECTRNNVEAGVGGQARSPQAWYGMVWYGMVWYGMVAARMRDHCGCMCSRSRQHFEVPHNMPSHSQGRPAPGGHLELSQMASG